MYRCYLNVLFLFIPLIEGSNGVSEKCELLRSDFAESISLFTACTIRYSRPIRMCENCVDSYRDVLDSYKNMTQLEENNTYCIDHFINLDRLQIIEVQYKNSIDLWNQAKCYDCFESDDDGPTPIRSNETIFFNNYFNKLEKCINGAYHNQTVCDACLQHYLTLNDYYASIIDENEKIGICMDIVDSMNVTRLYWSKNCCQYRKHNEYIFIVCTSVVLASAVVFYALAQLYSVKKTPTILQQRRFAESLSQSADR